MHLFHIMKHLEPLHWFCDHRELRSKNWDEYLLELHIHPYCLDHIKLKLVRLLGKLKQTLYFHLISNFHLQCNVFLLLPIDLQHFLEEHIIACFFFLLILAFRKIQNLLFWSIPMRQKIKCLKNYLRFIRLYSNLF